MKRYKDTFYFITEDGQVWSEHSKRFLKLIIHRGYHKVHLNFNENAIVHRLVAELYLENPENKPQVNHIDGNKLNNHYTNLEWCTQSENTKHAYDMKLMVALGEKNSNAKLTTEQVIEIRMLRSELNFKIKELSIKFKVDESTIKGIIYRTNWKHI